MFALISLGVGLGENHSAGTRILGARFRLLRDALPIIPLLS